MRAQHLGDDVRVALVRETRGEYKELLILTEGYNLVRTRNPEDNRLLLLIETDVEGVPEIFAASRKPTHIKLNTKIYTIDYGDLPISLDEDTIPLYIGGTGETNAIPEAP